jgi:hypothetical protein
VPEKALSKPLEIRLKIAVGSAQRFLINSHSAANDYKDREHITGGRVALAGAAVAPSTQTRPTHLIAVLAATPSRAIA